MNHAQEHMNTLWSLCSPESACILFDFIQCLEELEDRDGRMDIFDLYNDHFDEVWRTMNIFGKSYTCEILDQAQLKGFYRVSQ